MKMLVINPISFKKRMTEFLFDYLFILAYLVLLFLGSMLIYIIFFNGVPEFTEIQSQWLVFFTSVLPITLLFTFLDYWRYAIKPSPLNGKGKARHVRPKARCGEAILRC